MSDVSIGNLNVERALSRSVLDDWAKKVLFSSLAKISAGRLTIEHDSNITAFGESQAQAALHAHITIHHSSAYRQMLLRGSIGAGEAFMLGVWSSPCLVSVMRVMSQNIDGLNQMDRGWPFLQRMADKVLHRLNSNDLVGSRKNIAAHYDLGNDFFSLFLDPSLMYSAAIYPHATATLEEASTYKLDAICQKLQLSEADHLLEIGTGWGGLAVHAAKHYGCHVTTTTLSKEQYLHACQTVREQGLDDKVTLLLQDYRELEGSFDKLVSIEMIEAVGHEYYDTYFKKCSSLLECDGLMLIQAITIADQRYESAKTSVDFIQKYIFPGGGLPSNSVISSGLERCTDMILVDLHDIGLDYARTLAHWRERFHAQMEAVKAQGFDDVFCRMWDFYLAYCEGGFRERIISTVQVLCAKPQARQNSWRP